MYYQFNPKMLLKRHKILSLFKDIFIVAWDGKTIWTKEVTVLKDCFGNMALVEASMLAGMLIKYEEDLLVLKSKKQWVLT